MNSSEKLGSASLKVSKPDVADLDSSSSSDSYFPYDKHDFQVNMTVIINKIHIIAALM